MQYLLIAGACAVAAYGFGYFLMRRVQAHLLEYLITLVASTIPMGLILSVNQRLHGLSAFHGNAEMTELVCLGLLPVCLVIGGSVWGISIANRLQVQSAWRRIGLMVQGWGCVLGIISCGFLPIVISRANDPALTEGAKRFLPIMITVCPYFVVRAWLLERRAPSQTANTFAAETISRLPRP